MAKSEAHLSPEEKLLRVIQGEKKKDAEGGAPSGAAPTTPAGKADASAPASASAPAAAPVGPPEEAKGRVRLAKSATQAVPAGEAPRKGEPARTPTAAAKSDPPKPTPVAKRAVSGGDFSVRSLNIVLAVFIFVVLLLTVREIWANVRTGGTAEVASEALVPAIKSQETQGELPAIDSFLDLLEQRALFAQPGPSKGSDPGPVDGPTPDQYCKLMGISLDTEHNQMEAIIKDKKIDKTLYLKVGEPVVGDGQTWVVKEIQNEQVVLTNGKRDVTVK